jgi:putative sigma-54 modulation protein
MKITYTGKPPELSPKESAKLETKLAKLSKSIERKGEREVHVILTQTRHLHRAEITMNVYDHGLVGIGSDADLVTAMSSAIDKLEKQVLKLVAKWRDTHRHSTNKEMQPQEAAAPAVASRTAGKAGAAKKVATPAKPKVFRVNHQDGRKPMTLDEALLELGNAQDYFVYRDAKTDRICTLLRRSDGHVDLVES